MFRVASQPIRMVIVLPRLSDMSDLRKAICQMLSPAAPKNSSSSSSSSSHTSAENGSITAPYTLLPDNLMLLDCFRTVLDDRESILQLIESISRSAATNASMRTDSTAADSPVAPSNYPDNRTTKGQNVRHRSDSSSMSSPAAANSLKRSDSAATKMTQETSSGMTLHCVAVENPKDIPFICSLSPSRLGSRGARSTPPANFSLSPAGVSTDKLILNGNGTASDEKPDKSEGASHNASTFNPNFYSDELEYQEGSIDPTEGDVVADIDFDAPNSQKQTAGGEKVDDKTGKRKKDTAWPSSIEGLTIGRRVDGKDLAGQWCSGTVMDRWKVTAEELLELSTDRSQMSTGNGNGMSSSNPACSKLKRRGSDETTQLSRQGSRTTNMSKEKDRNKGPRTAGWNVRIHFDGVSDRWDEWFSALDFEQRLARIYSQKNRRLKVVQLAVVQRQITLRDSPRSAGSQSSPEAGQTKTFSVKVFGYPIMLQCESFRSCEHIYRVIAEQSIRYASPNQMRQMVESSVHRAVTSDSTFSDQSQSSPESLSLPFSIRIISTTSTPATDNLEGFDMDLGLIRVDERGKAGVPRRARARPSIPNGRSKSTDGLKEGEIPPYSSIWDRANGFQSWEGSYFPRDPFRPICNLIHDSLLVAVDWHWNSTNAPTSGQGKGLVNFRDHESYSKYIATQIPPSIPMAASALDTPKKTKEENRDQNGSATLTSSSATDLAQPAGHNARTSSSSAHPSLVDCLRSFTGTEELDEGSWHCDHCKKLSSGSVSSSLSRLPDLLIMHIKRFGMTARFREKIREKVIFPLTSLDMKPFVNISAGKTYFNLQSSI